MPTELSTRARIGTAVARLEDDALLRGRGRYVDDIRIGQLHAVFVRSPFAHARIVRVHTEVAAKEPGVAAVLTADDLGLAPMPPHPMMPAHVFDRPPLATGMVRYVGDPVAVVVGERRTAAVDAAEAVEVVYDQLPAMVDPAHAEAQDAPLLFPDHGSNVAFDGVVGSDDPLADADVVVRARLVNQRVAPAPMEPDGALALFDADAGVLTVWASTQRTHQLRDAVAASLGLARSAVRVIAPQVGGGFGGKFEPSAETVVVAALAVHLGRPVGWTQTRSENLTGMPHGRGQRQDAALGFRADGAIVGLEADITCDAGGYPMLGALIPNATSLMLGGPYRVPAVHCTYRSTATNTSQVGAYRGAGRPEACALMERLLDLAAVELHLDPVELRRRNLIHRDALPYTTPTGMTYDSGDYRACLDRVVDLVGYEEVRREQGERRRAGSSRLLGVGVAMWIDCTPMNRPGEYAAVAVAPDGDTGDEVIVSVRDGAGDQGQAHRTTWAILLSDTLGVPTASVHLDPNDTFLVPQGEGTGSARSLMLAGNAVVRAGAIVLDRARQIAAHLLEAAPDDVVVTPDGRLGVAGTPQRAVSWGAVARASVDPARLPPEVAAELAAEVDFVQPGPTFPSGAHAAVVEVDRETGKVTLLRFVAVDDCGRVVNPVVVAGQQQGGMAQGVAQALFEEIAYDVDGNPLTSTFADYLVPSAAELPGIEVHTLEVLSPVNPLGSKGIGQAGAIGSTPAVQSAVVDALEHLGVRHVDTPLTPERVWRAIVAAEHS